MDHRHGLLPHRCEELLRPQCAGKLEHLLSADNRAGAHQGFRTHGPVASAEGGAVSFTWHIHTRRPKGKAPSQAVSRISLHRLISSFWITTNATRSARVSQSTFRGGALLPPTSAMV